MGAGRSTAWVLLALAALNTSGCATSSPSSTPAASRPAVSTTAHTPPNASTPPTGGTQTSPAATQPTGTSTASTSAPTSALPSVSPSTSTTTTPEPNSSPHRAAQAQIPGAKLPGFNAQWHWDRVGRLHDLVSPCMRSTLVSIGAVNQAGRTFSSSGGASTDEAAQLTGVFPDEHTAITAAAVLTAWHDKCAKNAASDGLKHVGVSDLRDVPTPVGTGHQWMLTYRPVAGQPNATWFVSQGFVRDGDTITWLVYVNAGQDYNYPAGAEPIDGALAVAGRYLQRSR